MKHIKCFCAFFVAFFMATSAIAQINNGDLKIQEIQARTLKTNLIPFLEKSLSGFSEQRYESLRPFILEKNIPEIQKAIYARKFSYLELTQFFLFRIAKYETNANTSLHAIIALNPHIIAEAKEKDVQLKNRKAKHDIFGMPILLKDNIGSKNMKTTAGALALIENEADDAFIVKRLKARGALILGKVNLSEWAYYLSFNCPMGYSAVGGQTLNPYGPGKFETGGSSSGSAVAVASNYAVASIGTETSGSILSPSSKNAVVGLKPTVGSLSRTGIVPLSSTFDTPGPITKNVVDNAIVFSAMLGNDEIDPESIKVKNQANLIQFLKTASLKGKRFGVISSRLTNSLYANAVAKLKDAGAIMVELNYDTDFSLIGYMLNILGYDFKNDLNHYLQNYASKNVKIKSVSDLVNFNEANAALRIPFGQSRIETAEKDTSSLVKITAAKNKLKKEGGIAFEKLFSNYSLDAILSIDNNNAMEAAIAKYPALAMPMGYSAEGEPTALTFIAKPFEEYKLLSLAAAYERISLSRKPPASYQ